MKYDHINFRPPSGVKAEANRGLAWRREFGRGGTAIGVARARDLGNGTKISPETARRMKAFFDRHQSDRNAEGWSPGEKGFPSNGRIAHALWGGDAGYAWSRKLVRQMEAADNARSIREFLEARGFCGTGKGGGVDNSCSSKDGGGGGGGGSGGGGKGKEGKSGSVGDGYAAKGYGPKYSGNPGEGDISAALDEAVGAFWTAPTVYQDGKFLAEIEAKPDQALKAVQGTLKRKGWETELDGGTLTAHKKGRGVVHRLEIRPAGRLSKSDSAENVKGVAVLRGRVLAPLVRVKSSGVKSSKPKKRSHEMQIETRSLCIDDFSEDDAFPLLSVETRCEGDGQPEQKWVVGYAARFGVNSLKMDDFYERIDPNAFSIVTERRGRKSPLETRALFNHDPNVVLGRFPNTLKMKVDEHGLRYEILMPESRSDIVELIQRGDIRGSSFSFIVSPGGEDWSVEEGRSIRTVKSIASLVDVGPVTYPAYPDASVSVAKRSYEAFMRSQNKPRRDFVSFAGKIAELQTFLKARTR